MLLLGLVLAVEGGGLVLTLAQRPHISRVVTACEVVCSCLHVASTGMLLAAHFIAHGDASAADSVMQVGGGQAVFRFAGTNCICASVGCCS